MDLMTPVHIAPVAWSIGYDDKILMLGSCFADSISSKMCEYYFQVTCNPFGTLYNPLSIAEAWQQTDVPPLVEWGGLWHSMCHHGNFSSADRSAVFTRCGESIDRMQQAISDASVVVITWGTAWVYERDGKVVANCHKMPSSMFRRRRMTVDEIVSVWQPIVVAHPDKHFIFTVSPIRYMKDGLHENQLSKATLLLATERLRDMRCDYFPSYEILLDELRDYRFFAEDMVHPSSLAIQYIWDCFVRTYISSDTQEVMRTMHQLYKDRHHILLHPDSPESLAFTQRLREREQQLRVRYPWL